MPNLAKEDNGVIRISLKSEPSVLVMPPERFYIFKETVEKIINDS